MPALLARIPWLASTVGGFVIGWLGGWPGESDESAAGGTVSTLGSLLWVALGVVVGVFAVTKIAKA
jgi:hypothetical protein